MKIIKEKKDNIIEYIYILEGQKRDFIKIEDGKIISTGNYLSNIEINYSNEIFYGSLSLALSTIINISLDTFFEIYFILEKDDKINFIIKNIINNEKNKIIENRNKNNQKIKKINKYLKKSKN